MLSVVFVDGGMNSASDFPVRQEWESVVNKQYVLTNNQKFNTALITK